MDADKELEQLKLLFDYTKFHIGMYTTVATIFGGLIAADKGPFKFDSRVLFAAVIFICLAGVAGGVIASSIPGFNSYKTFWRTPIGPMRFKILTAEYWTYIEHSAFWIAVVLALLSVGLK
jgi:hypothetical protein